MKKLFISLFLLFMIVVVLVIIPNSPINKPILKQLTKAVEKDWEARITYADAGMHLWKGGLTFDDLIIESSGQESSRWSLAVRNLTVDVDYPSWFLDTLTINRLTIHGIIFSRNVEQQSARQRDKVFQKVSGEKKKEAPEKIETGIEQGFLIKHLIIQGKLELETVHESGKTNRVEIESFTIDRKDILFDGNPEAFLSSILKSTP